MAVKEYKKGEHSGGFVGLRVYRSVGGTKSTRQRYFSYNAYTPMVAHLIAHSLDCAWADEAEELRKHNRLMSSRGPDEIARGFTLKILRKVCGRSGTITYTPCFMVSVPNIRARRKTFSVSGGYVKAYIAAVKIYVKQHDLKFSQSEELYRRRPDPSVFTDVVLPKMVDRGWAIQRSDIEHKLGKLK
jgi:hypothetical protein